MRISIFLLVLFPSVRQFDTLDSPPEVTLRCLESGKLLAFIHDRADPASYETIARLRMKPPDIFDVETEEENSSLEKLPLYGAVYKPDESVFGRGPYPLASRIILFKYTQS